MYLAIVSFTGEEDYQHSLNVMSAGDDANNHILHLVTHGFTVFVKPHDNYGSAIQWANKQYYKE